MTIRRERKEGDMPVSSAHINRATHYNLKLRASVLVHLCKIIKKENNKKYKKIKLIAFEKSLDLQ